MFLRATRLLQCTLVSCLLTCGLVASVSTPRRVATLSSATATVPSTRANFASPPLFSVFGPNIGIAGLFSMAKGDFNHDGNVDFAVVGFACANGVGDSVAVYLGNGDGTFMAPKRYPTGPCPYQVIVARLRGDNGPEDLITVDNGFQQLGFSVLLGNDDGTFQTAQSAPLPTTPTAAAAGDFNRDGKIDLAISLFGGSGADGGNLQSLAVLIGHGDGNFEPPVMYQSLNNPYGVVSGDFNNDGKTDLVLRNPEALALSLGNGDGTFLPSYVILVEPTTLVSVTPPGPILNGLVSFLAADFNEDGNLDIAAQEDGVRIDVMLGTGTGVFQPPVTYLNDQHQTGHGGGQMATAVLRNSGHLDLVVSTGYGTTLGIFRGNGDGSFQPPELHPLPQYNAAPVLLADLNNDAQADIITGNQGGHGASPNYLTVLLNKGDGDFGTPPPLYSVIAPVNQVTATNAVGIVLADLSGTGKLDAIVTDWDVPIEPLANGETPVPPHIDVESMTVNTHGSISVLAGNGDGTFAAERQYFVGGRPLGVQSADLTSDGKVDVVVTNAFENTISILKGNGDRTLQPAITITVGKNPNALVLNDFNGDGKPDIAVTNLTDNNISILLNQSTPGVIQFGGVTNFPVGTHPAGLVAGDFNHDRKPDLAVLNSGDSFGDNVTSLSILLGNNDGSFAPAATQILWNGANGAAIGVADFGRGELDLVAAHFTRGEVMILRGNGNGTFAKSDTYRVGAGPEGIVTVDFDRDGKADIAVNNLNDNTVTFFRGKGDGTFGAPVDTRDDTARRYGWAAWGYPAFIAAGDLAGTGKPDIVVTNLFEPAITVLRNTTLTPDELARIFNLTSIIRLENGHVLLRGRSLPNRTVRVESGRSLDPASFSEIAAINVNDSGEFEFEDSNASDSPRFYRLTLP